MACIPFYCYRVFLSVFRFVFSRRVGLGFHSNLDWGAVRENICTGSLRRLEQRDEKTLHVATTHKGTDFDALASAVAARLLFPDAVVALPSNVNQNVNAFLTLHRDLFDAYHTAEIDLEAVDKLTVVDTNQWNRLERLDALKDKQILDIRLFDHHGKHGDIRATGGCQEPMGANITLMLRYIKSGRIPITPILASLFLLGLYEDTGNLTFPATRAEDARATAYLLENGADLKVIDAFLIPTYGRKQKDILFRMLSRAQRMTINGYTVSIGRVEVSGYTENLAFVVQIYRQILNTDAAFGIFALEKKRCLVIGRSRAEEIDIAGIMRNMGGGGHPAAGSALLKSVDPDAVESWVREMIGDHHQSATRIGDLMSVPVWTLSQNMSMEEAGRLLREKGYKGAPVMDAGRLIGMLSKRDFQKIRRPSQLKSPVRAYMSPHVVTIGPKKGVGQGANLMIKNNIGRLPVTEGGKMIGIFSRSDAVANFYGLCPLGTYCSKRPQNASETFTPPPSYTKT